ncbi:FAD-dependent oxidoreductase [Xaviernesmea oryzae]|uniref:FAD-dependent oxidoreductase n=1 Tax=Xaviernesmea oryzae TaxID=464029 RepID=A0A1Q9B209_9HYPH|nr:FAD-dependent oxidoreductase [Xaviernesmea oryzae]OLP62038.1 FAD-dependent oxidoreductase [Xaviernesmea oryzae]SEK95995.1 FAD dependent oxidoreductase [Xaviernesmea oryzae]
MSFKVAVIGAGWYGCHIASSLASLGFDVRIFESERRTLHCASGNNQFRLHMGFHYARHHGTRQQSRDGFLRFIERYPDLSHPIEKNIYAIPVADSLIDFPTYKLIMASSGIDFVETTDFDQWLKNVSGAVLTQERVLMIKQAREHFEKRLKGILHLNATVRSIEAFDSHVRVEGEKYDYVIDATWGHFSGIPRDIYYEPTMLLYYEAQYAHPAITMVDGPLCSVYPTEDPSIFTLSSVEHTPLGTYISSAAAWEKLNSVGSDLVELKRNAMENQITRYVPNFKECFKFRGVQLSIKTKPVGKDDDRSCAVYRDKRTFSVMSGKIDTIFYATERILSLLEENNSSAPLTRNFAIQNDILQLDLPVKFK